MTSFVAVAALAATAFASPLNLPTLVARQDFGSCRNQSCLVATVAGSTGSHVYPYAPVYPVNDQNSGDCCIIRYFPAVKNALYGERPGLQAYCAANGGDAPLDANPPGIDSVTITSGQSPTQPPPSYKKRELEIEEREVEATVSKVNAAGCKPNILIYAKGTLEPGDLGITVGPQLASGLDSTKWQVTGVQYDNSFDNDYCLGLPGGINVRAALANATSVCPQSRIALSGYSQGALVVRNALARAPLAQVKKVVNVVTFGDPMVGAPIGQYTHNGGPLHVFCMNGDGVCNGQLDVGLAHLSYFLDVSQGVAILQSTQAN